MGSQPNVFVGVLTGQNEGHNTTITLIGGTPPPSPPGVGLPPPPPSIPVNTITVNGEKGEITAGGNRQAGTLTIANGANRNIAILSAAPDTLQIFRALGAKTINIQGDPDGILQLFTGEGAKT